MRLVLAMIAAFLASGAVAQVPSKADGAVRFATFNAALNEREAGGIVRRLDGGSDPQAKLVAEVIQRVRPDVLLLQELDRDPELRSLAAFRTYLAAPQEGAEPIDYPYAVFPASNTGVGTGVDLDGDGTVKLPNDARGFGYHPGQYAFALLSRFPIDGVATYANLLWRDVRDSALPPGHYSDAALAVLPLSSKTHLAASVLTPEGAIRVVAAHPTPPVFDDAGSDFNGRRNADEIRLLLELMTGLVPYPPDAPVRVATDLRKPRGAAPAAGETLRSDPPVAPGGVPVVAMGDLNADPQRGDARPGAIARLLDDPAVNDVVPRSASHGDMTAEFNGGMRVDYVLPTKALEVTGSGVFWPTDDDPLARLNEASDHHLVWIDVRLP